MAKIRQVELEKTSKKDEGIATNWRMFTYERVDGESSIDERGSRDIKLSPISRSEFMSDLKKASRRVEKPKSSPKSSKT